MKLDIGGSEAVVASGDQLWAALNNPVVLTRCIPGCKSMIEIAPNAYKVESQLRVAAPGGSFESEIALSDIEPPRACTIRVSGAGTLGHGNGTARFEIEPEGENASKLMYKGNSEIGGLVAGVGQRILSGVSKHLIGGFCCASENRRRMVTTEGTTMKRVAFMALLLALLPRPAPAADLQKVTIVVFGAPSLGAFLPPVIKAQKLDEKHGLSISFEERTPDAYTAQFNSGEFKVGGSAALLTVGG